jgi:hypothetical protein
MNSLYRTTPHLNTETEYDIMGRRCRWLGSTEKDKITHYEFSVEGDLAGTRTYTEEQILRLIHAGAFRLSSR